MRKRVGKAVIAAFLAGLLAAIASAQKKPLTIGIVTGQLENSSAQSFQPFLVWMDAHVPGQTFRMVQFASIEDLLKAAQRRRIDFAFSTPAAMVELNVRYGARAIATIMQPIPGGQNYPWLAGAAFVRDARTDMRSLEDLRGKRVIALSPLALGGWLSVVREWRKAGIREDNDLANVRFVFSYERVVQGVCSGQADAGILAASAFLTAEPLCREKLRVLPGINGGTDPRYPTAISTRLYPEEAFAVMGEEDESVVAQVSTALLAIESGSDVAKAATVGGFTAPLSYQPVQQLMQELRLRPFESYGRLTPRQLVQQYGSWILGVLVSFLGVLLWALLHTRRLNAKLRTSEEFRKRVFEGSHLPIVVMDAETGRCLDCNPAATAIYGYSSREETLARTSAEKSAPLQAGGRPSGQMAQEYIERAIAEGMVAFEWSYQRPGGEIWDAEVHLMSFRSGQKQLLQFTLEDITGRKRAEQMRATLASVLEASHDFISLATMHGKITYLNKGAREMVGLEDRDESTPLQIGDFFAPADLERFEQFIMPAFLRAGWTRAESRLRHFRTGRLIPVEIEGLVIRDAHGAPVCLATVTRDLTERYEAQRQKEKLETRLVQAQKMEALGRLTGGIAHDFNNSLSVILGYAAMLACSDRLSAKEQDAVRAISDAGVRSRDMIGQLLGFSRQQVIAPLPLDLNRQIADSRDLLARLLGEDVELNVLPGDDLWSVMLDSTQVHQMLMNLAANARDAMPNGGKLTVETANVVVDEANGHHDPASPTGEYVLLAVSDTGIGMDEATVAQIFEPFFTTKERGEGTGLGLATVYGIVRQNRGFINVYSEPNRGATFKLYFPRLAGVVAAPSQQAPEPASAMSRRNGSILLVEDDELVRTMTADTLVYLGFEPLVAESPQDAIEICRDQTKPVDMVISDVVMPGMKGTDLRDRLLDLRPGLKVLFVSGYTSDVIVRHGVLRPGVHFLQKPFSVEGLAAKIEELLGRQR